MRRHLLPAMASLALAVCAVDDVQAQCAFEHPKTAKKFQSSFTTAFIPCAGLGFSNPPNTSTEGGVPACKPPETFNEAFGGFPPTGWTWDETTGQGQVQFKSAVAVPPITPADSMDLTVKLKVKGVLANVGPASGPGTLTAIARVTLDDRASGDMTIVDYPAQFPFTLTDGKVSTKTSVDAALNGIPQPGLPHCSSLELLFVAINDSNNNQFASTGIFLK